MACTSTFPAPLVEILLEVVLVLGLRLHPRSLFAWLQLFRRRH